MRWLTRIANLCRPLRHLWHPRVRLTMSWIIALAVVGGMFYFPAHWFPDGLVKALHIRDGAAWKSFAVDGYDLTLQSPLDQPSALPTAGRNLIVVAPVHGVLHFRIFDGAGNLLKDSDEIKLKDNDGQEKDAKKLQEKAKQIEALRQRLEPLWPPHVLTAREKAAVFNEVNDVVDLHLDMTHPSGTHGHNTIDFGGQYLMARMLATGHGRSLYDRKVQRPVLEEAYNSGYIDPKNGKSDGEALLGQTIDDKSDEGRALERGGALYPPVHALMFAPMGFLTPVAAYRTIQILHVVLTILLGVVVQIGTRGRVWAPVAIVAIVCYPGYAGSINLGQNSLLSLVLLGTGWCLLSRNRPLLGGICWGLLAFKPVWALSFMVAPLLMGRWRFVLSMCATGAGLVLLSLPFVGIQAWFDWLAVGKSADATYITDENWVHLSRDVQGLLRRLLADWPKEGPLQYRFSENLYRQAGVIPVVLVVGVTLVVGLLAAFRRRREWRKLRAVDATALAVPERTEGPGAAFLLLSGWLACWHFMYYDLLVSALGVGALFAAPSRYLRPVFLKSGDNGLADDQKRFYGCTIGAPAPLRPDGWKRHWVSNPFGLILVVGFMLTWPIGTLIYDGAGVWRAPVDTWLLILLWGWCGWIWLVQPDFLAEPKAISTTADKSDPLCSTDNHGDSSPTDAIMPEMSSAGGTP